MVGNNFPNFIERAERPANSPEINLTGNHWSIIDEFAYKDPIPKTTEGAEMATQTSMGKRHVFHPTRFITLHAVAAVKCDKK